MMEIFVIGMTAMEFALFAFAFLPAVAIVGYGLAWFSRKTINAAGEAADRLMLGTKPEEQAK